MAINRSSLTSQSVKENTDITLLLLQDKPVENQYLDSPVAPNRMVGYYNDALDHVELYITDAEGRRYIRIR